MTYSKQPVPGATYKVIGGVYKDLDKLVEVEEVGSSLATARYYCTRSDGKRFSVTEKEFQDNFIKVHQEYERYTMTTQEPNETTPVPKEENKKRKYTKKPKPKVDPPTKLDGINLTKAILDEAAFPQAPAGAVEEYDRYDLHKDQRMISRPLFDEIANKLIQIGIKQGIEIQKISNELFNA